MSDRANSLPLSPVELAEVREIAAHAEFETSAVGRLFATIDALDAELQQLGDGVNPALERFRLRQTIDSLTARLEAPEQMMETTLNADGSTTVKRLACKNCARSSEITDAYERDVVEPNREVYGADVEAARDVLKRYRKGQWHINGEIVRKALNAAYAARNE